MTTILDLLDDAARGPTWMLFASEASERIPFSEVWERSAVAADRLSSTTTAGDTVAMVLNSSLDALAALLGAWRAGLTVASLPDPSRVGVDEYRSILVRIAAEISPRHVLVSEKAMSRLGEVDGVPMLATSAAFQPAPGGRRDEIGSFIQLTSGSTRSPSGVRISLESAAANVQAVIERLWDGTVPVVCSWMPLSHDMGLFGGCLTPLVSGATIGSTTCLIDTAHFSRRPNLWLRTCSDVRATITLATSSALPIAERLAARAKGLDLHSIKSCIIGAEQVRPTALASFVNVYAGAGFRENAFLPAYGMAENTLAISLPSLGEPLKVHRVAAPGAVQETEVLACGRPVDGTEVRVVEDDQVGELAVRGASLFSGYTGTRPAGYDKGWFLTNDVGSVIEGEVYPMGRADDTIVVRGLNLLATDLEAVVADVTGAGVPGVAAVPFSDGFALVLEVASATGFDALAIDARAECARRFGVAPTRIVAVPRRHLPRTASGKLRRKNIRRRLAGDELDILASRE